MSKKIPINHGMSAVVDDDDYLVVSTFRWGFDRKTGRVMRKFTIAKGLRRNIRLHQLLILVPLGMVADHVNGNPLDNRRVNLRVCTYTENSRNRRRAVNNSSGFKGVDYVKADKCFRARIFVNGKRICLGKFKSAREAAIAYEKGAKRYFKSFART